MQEYTGPAELRAVLFSVRETRPASHIYVLLDNACPVAADHPLHPDNLSARPVARERAIVGGKAASEEAKAWRPTLVQLYRSGEHGYADEELLDLTWDCAVERCASINGAYVAAWIATDLDTEKLAERLARDSKVFDISRGRQEPMHLHQPYRMSLLGGTEEGTAFLHGHLEGIHAWIHVDAAASLRNFKAETGKDIRPARLSLAMCRALHRVPLGRQALMGIRKAELPVPPRAESVIDEHLVLAAEQGLTHPEDVIFFVLNSLSLSARWFEHPRARQLIRQAAADGAPLVGLFAELPPEVADEIGNWPAR